MYIALKQIHVKDKIQHIHQPFYLFRAHFPPVRKYFIKFLTKQICKLFYVYILPSRAYDFRLQKRKEFKINIPNMFSYIIFVPWILFLSLNVSQHSHDISSKTFISCSLFKLWHNLRLSKVIVCQQETYLRPNIWCGCLVE